MSRDPNTNSPRYHRIPIILSHLDILSSLFNRLHHYETTYPWNSYTCHHCTFTRSPFPHPYFYTPYCLTSTAMSKLTKVRIYFCTRQFWLLCSKESRNANFDEQMGSGFFANTTQTPYRRCALLQAKTLSLMRSPILHPFYMSAGSAIGLIYTA